MPVSIGQKLAAFMAGAARGQQDLAARKEASDIAKLRTRMLQDDLTLRQKKFEIDAKEAAAKIQQEAQTAQQRATAQRLMTQLLGGGGGGAGMGQQSGNDMQTLTPSTAEEIQATGPTSSRTAQMIQALQQRPVARPQAGQASVGAGDAGVGGLAAESMTVDSEGKMSIKLGKPKSVEAALVATAFRLHPNDPQKRIEYIINAKERIAQAGASRTSLNISSVSPETLARQEAIVSNLTLVESLFDESYVGPIAGRASSLFASAGLLSQAELTFRSALLQLQLQLRRRYLGSTQTLHELKGLFEAIPDVTNSPSQFRANLKLTLANERRMQKRLSQMSQGQIDRNVKRNLKLIEENQIKDIGTKIPEGIPADADFVGISQDKKIAVFRSSDGKLWETDIE